MRTRKLCHPIPNFRALVVLLTSCLVAAAADAQSSLIGSPEIIATQTNRQYSNPLIAGDGSGTWVTVWSSQENLNFNNGWDSDIFFSRSIDNGATWSPPAIIDPIMYSDVTGDGISGFATDGAGTWIVTFSSAFDPNDTNPQETDVFYVRSTDNGATWSSRGLLDTDAATDGASWDVAPTLTTDGSGRWVAVWFAYENFHGATVYDWDIYGAYSSDNGATWSAPFPVNSDALIDAPAESDRSPRITVSATGTWIVVWESRRNADGVTGYDDDVFFARSTDGGVTWSNQRPLNGDYLGYSHDSQPQIATDDTGHWIVAWQSEDLPEGHDCCRGFPVIARSVDDGLTWSSTLSTAPENDTGLWNPWTSFNLVDDTRGNWIIVMSNRRDPNGSPWALDREAYFYLSTNLGKNWTAPMVLNADARTDDDREDYTPALAFDTAGNGIAAWPADATGSSGPPRFKMLHTELNVAKSLPASSWPFLVATLALLLAGGFVTLRLLRASA